VAPLARRWAQPWLLLAWEHAGLEEGAITALHRPAMPWIGAPLSSALGCIEVDRGQGWVLSMTPPPGAFLAISELTMKELLP